MKLGLIAASFAALAGCASSNIGTQSTPSSSKPDVTGTVFTILFENENATQVITPANRNFWTLAQTAGRATEYISTTHPSLPNYIMLTSGSTNGINTDNDPRVNISLPGDTNLADQLDKANVPWRAYMETMGTPCKIDSDGDYCAHHNPFLYYESMMKDPARCQEHIVDFDANFQTDLDSNAYKYMWITPNMCNDMHNCDGTVADAWLGKTVAQITASKGYQNGGALFILFDEGSTRYLGASAELATIVMSPKLVSQPYISNTFYDHRSYLATVEDIFGLPRLSTTADATSMNDFFVAASTPPAASPAPGTAVPAAQQAP